MEQDEIKLAWKELNDKINASSLANKETLAYILKTRRKTTLQRMIIADKSSIVFIGLLTLVVICFFLFAKKDVATLLLRTEAIILLLVTCILNIICYFRLIKIKLDESVSVFYKKVSSYKKSLVWIYLVVYVLVFIFIGSLLFTYPHASLMKTLLAIIMPAAIALDCFLFHWSSNHIKTLIETTKELKELNKEE